MAHWTDTGAQGTDPTVRPGRESLMLPVPLPTASEGEDLDVGFLDFLCKKYFNSFLAAEFYP